MSDKQRELIEKLERQVMDLGRLNEKKDLEVMDKREASIYRKGDDLNGKLFT